MDSTSITDILRLLEMAFFVADIHEGCTDAPTRMRNTMRQFVNSPALVERAMSVVEQFMDDTGITVVSPYDLAAMYHCLECMTVHLN